MNSVIQKVEIAFERLLFAARWLLAPFYLGMVFALVAILVVFVRDLLGEFTQFAALDSEHVIMLSLSLIELSLTANLVLIVIFAGYENFVSRMRVEDREDRPAWMGTIDFSGLKIKLIASMVVISGIALLRAFLPLGDAGARVDAPRLYWMIAIHLAFIVSGVLMAAMDWITARSSHDATTTP
jgi:uncharacterized protein (TIGR00645 family)